MTEVEIAVVKSRTPAHTNVKVNDVESQTSTVSIKSNVQFFQQAKSQNYWGVQTNERSFLAQIHLH